MKLFWNAGGVAGGATAGGIAGGGYTQPGAGNSGYGAFPHTENELSYGAPVNDSRFALGGTINLQDGRNGNGSEEEEQGCC